MATHWQEWEKKIGQIFENVGFSKLELPGKGRVTDLTPGTYRMEPINNEMQVDVFVRINQTQYLVIECRDRRNKTIKKWLHEIKGRASVRQAQLRRELKSKKIEVYGVAATSLRDLDIKVQKAADDTGVALWHHGVVDYLMAISKGAGIGVKDLVLYRAGIKQKKYEPIVLQVQRWPVENNDNWFIGFISPLQIAQATFVYQRGQGFGESSYQRFLKPQRITAIGNYVKESGGTFPNSIVLALPKGTKFSRTRNGGSIMQMSIPGNPEGIKIIDGQHRFFGALASGINVKLLCTFVECEDLDQAIMFSQLNGRQVTVSKAQITSLYGIPDFAARIAVGASSEKDKEKIDTDATVYRALERMNQKGPLANRLNFYPGRPAQGKIPFKVLFDTLARVAKIEQSGFKSLSGDQKTRGKEFGDKLSTFLAAWEYILGKENFNNIDLWLQPTMLSALLLLYPECRWYAGKSEASTWLRNQRKITWNPRPENYRGGQGTSKLAHGLCSRLKIRPQFIFKK